MNNIQIYRNNIQIIKYRKMYIIHKMMNIDESITYAALHIGY